MFLGALFSVNFFKLEKRFGLKIFLLSYLEAYPRQ